MTVIRINPENDYEEEIQGKNGEWEFALYQNDGCRGMRDSIRGKGDMKCQKGITNGSAYSYTPVRMAANCKAFLYSDDDCDNEITEIKPRQSGCKAPDDAIRSWNVECPF